jgi:hypothetical protein
MLSQRLGVERLAGLKIGHQAANMLLREAQPGGSDPLSTELLVAGNASRPIEG